MSYRCQVCDWKVPHGQAMLRHLVRRTEAEPRDKPKGRADCPEYREIPAGTILREVKVCERCHRRLEGGRGLGDLIQEAVDKARRESLPSPVEEAADIFADPLEVGKVRLGS